MSRAKDKFWPMVLSLTLIAIISGGLLAVVYDLTKEPIAKSKEIARQENLKQILPSFDTIKDTTFNNVAVSVAYLNDSIAGYAITSEAPGYGGPVKIMVGYLPDGIISDYAVLEHQETPGLGAKAASWFKKSIPGGDAYTTYTVTKDGGNVDAITAATITSRAFLEAVNKTNVTFLSIIKSQQTKKEATNE